MLRPAVGDSLFTSEGELVALATQSGRASVRTAQRDGTGAGDDGNSRAQRQSGSCVAASILS